MITPEYLKNKITTMVTLHRKSFAALLKEKAAAQNLQSE
jgi:hypothetical protein